MLCKCFAGYVKAKLITTYSIFLYVMKVSNDMKNMDNALKNIINGLNSVI